MNTEFKFILQPYTGQKSRTTCPACQKKNQLARYIDIEAKAPLADHVGRCNREINCGYHYTPKQYFEEQKLQNPDQQRPVFKHIAPHPSPAAKVVSNIPFELMKRTRKAYEQNNFAQFLFAKLGQEKALQVLGLYHVGTSKHWQGANVFWQIDTSGRVRAGKVMLYDSSTGHRVKEPFPHITWIHKLANLQGYQLSQCFFGEHLLQLYPEKRPAIVESEKTAMLAAAYWPEFNWLAAGNLNNLTRERCEPLQGKTVLLFPDAGAFQIWQAKAASLKDLASFEVSDLIEKNATPEQLKQGFDLADYLEGQEALFTGRKEFEQNPVINILEEERPEETVLPDQIAQLQKVFDAEIQVKKQVCRKFAENEEALEKNTSSESWPIEELEAFFASAIIPEEPFRLNAAMLINNPAQFIESHLGTIKANNGKPRFKPYFERLNRFKELLSK